MDISLALAGLAWLPWVCIIAGLVFIIVEMFHPGIGAPGIIGAILLVAGVILTASTPLQALIMIVILLAILGVAFMIVLQSATRGHLARHLVLNASLDDDMGFTGSDDLKYFIGSEGKTLTVLRPSGTADFSGVKLDVVSEGEFIPRGSTVIITKVEGHRIVVARKSSVS